MYHLYILHSEKSDIYYVGSSDDPHRRLEEHNNKPFNTFTSKHRPWSLMAIFPISENRAEAMVYEKKLKSLKSRIIIQQLIARNGDTKFLAQLVRVPTGRD